MIAEIDADYPTLDESRRGAELVRELISHLIGAVILRSAAPSAAGSAGVCRGRSQPGPTH